MLQCRALDTTPQIYKENPQIVIDIGPVLDENGFRQFLMAARIELADLKARIEETRREYEAAKRKAEQLHSELEAYARVLDVEQRRQAGTNHARTVALTDRATGVNRIQFIRSFIASQREAGVNAKDIIEAAEKAAVDVPRDYVYTVLLRLRKGGEIEERNRRYFPVGPKRQES